MKYKNLKRIMDLTVSSVGLMLLSPLFILVGTAIKIEDGGSIFFKQKRVGLHEKIFLIYKFRSMVPNAEKKGIKLTSATDNRKTKVGRIIRKYKIDELPQLINVVKGEMSLVGPRPEVPEYYPYIKKLFPEIVNLKPGITDYASLKFSNEEEILANYEDRERAYIEIVLPAKVELYKKYYEDMSFKTDMKLLIMTLLKVLKGNNE